uniref:E3 ubiquitin-protein ligase DTX3L isoform X2 n=1 Tax=Scatophagus argus TaxID=75038 RepID=UPI001ED8201E|nr:E3 ubiquitin-protein ligase DTX3L isoform X2 [Scatophagus argus]
MEFITDITIIIDEAEYTDPGILMTFLQSYSPEKKGSCYKVRGTYEQLEKLSIKLSAVRHHFSTTKRGPICQQHEQPSTQVKSVYAAAVVMDYIEQKCAKELTKIGGKTFFIETHPDIRKVHTESSNIVQVTFRPHHVSIYPVHADFVRQRFITLYQRTASDLQVTSVCVSPYDHKDIQRRFPQLTFKPTNNKYQVTVIGPFVHISKLKELILQNMQSSSTSPINKGSPETSSSRTSGPSPTHSKDPEDESCPICMELIVTTKKETLQCNHSFCRNCLKQAFDYKPVCPTCGEVYGTLTGTQPDGGIMNVSKTSSSLPGYEKYGTIIIHYYIPSGIQKEEHPNPGQPYEGVSRTAYLPDSLDGRRIVKLLRQAFDQRLIFTVGQSTTTGKSNMVTWNDIHHKTSTHGGPTQYGYPDPDYLSRVRDELTVKGIK